MVIDIYMHTNTINGKKYIGITKNGMEYRFKQHVWKSNNNTTNNHFHNAIKKYGVDVWESVIIKQVDNYEEASKLEKYYIEKYDTIENGYNGTDGGEGCFVLSERVKRKMKYTHRNNGGHNTVDMIGEIVGRLLVIDKADSRNKNAYWTCVCECGNICEVKGKYLRSGSTKSCGCLRKEQAPNNSKRKSDV